MAKQKEFKCKRCGESDPDNFYAGYKSVCRSCKNEDVKARYNKKYNPNPKKKVKVEVKVPKLRKCRVCGKFKNKLYIKKDSTICDKCTNRIKKEEEEALRIKKEAEESIRIKEEEQKQYEEDFAMNRFDIIRIYESLDKEEQIRILAEIDESNNIFNNIEEVISQIKDARILAELWCDLYLKYGEDYNLNKIERED